MSEITDEIKRRYQFDDFSCPKCCSSEVSVVGYNGFVSAQNPFGEKGVEFSCNDCGEESRYIGSNASSVVRLWLVKTKRMYTCTFLFREMACMTDSYDGIGEFTDGFWVDKDCKLTKGSDCVYWIPPCKIEDIEIEEITVRLSEK